MSTIKQLNLLFYSRIVSFHFIYWWKLISSTLYNTHTHSNTHINIYICIFVVGFTLNQSLWFICISPFENNDINVVWSVWVCACACFMVGMLSIFIYMWCKRILLMVFSELNLSHTTIHIWNAGRRVCAGFECFFVFFL